MLRADFEAKCCLLCTLAGMYRTLTGRHNAKKVEDAETIGKVDPHKTDSVKKGTEQLAAGKRFSFTNDKQVLRTVTAAISHQLFLPGPD